MRLRPRIFENHKIKIGFSPQNGKVDLCTTNGSKVLIYLTLLNFLLHYLQEYSKIWNTAKSNKSELWNCLSYRGLPYLFEVRSQTLFYDFQNFKVAASKFRGRFSFDLNDLERPKWEFKKMSWDNPVFPIDTENSIGFFVQFFLG